jgi:hypothetical protein
MRCCDNFCEYFVAIADTILLQETGKATAVRTLFTWYNKEVI